MYLGYHEKREEKDFSCFGLFPQIIHPDPKIKLNETAFQNLMAKTLTLKLVLDDREKKRKSHKYV